MLIGAASAVSFGLEVLGGIVAVLGVVAMVAFMIAYFRARGGQAFSSLQSETIADLETANNEKADRIQNLEEKVEDLSEQVRVLRELVTQAAKVDLVRDEQSESFKKVMARLAIMDEKLDRKAS